MPYITPEQVKAKRNELKKTFPSFKFSVTGKNYTSLYVTILAAPIMLTDKKYEQVNPYYIHSHYTGEIKDTLQKIRDIANRSNYTEVVDSDYGSVPSFYLHISIGEYDKPFIYTGK